MIKYQKRGGIHFVKIGRFGFNFYRSRKPKPVVHLPYDVMVELNHGIAAIVRGL